MDPVNDMFDDSGDDELAELRLAALATLKPSTEEKSQSDISGHTDAVKVVTSVPSSTYPSHFPNDQSTAQYARRSSTQPPRRGGGRGRSFPKINPRSNLIVITPVNLGEKSEESREPAPQLVLPQHKWSQVANEDSSSPKTYRKTGPSRFNRHESRSDSSDSDYDKSDNDSYSNETILQDEPSEHFSQLTPDESMDREESVHLGHHTHALEKRLNFQNIDSNLSSMPKDEIVDKAASLSSASKETFSEKSYLIHNQYNPSINTVHSTQGIDTSAVNKTQIPTSVNGKSQLESDFLSSCGAVEADSTGPQQNSGETGSTNGAEGRRTYVNRNRLSETDLRLELKKRMQQYKSYDGSKEQNECGDHRAVNHGSNFDPNSQDHGEKQNFAPGPELNDRPIQNSVRKPIRAPSLSPPPKHRNYGLNSKRNSEYNRTSYNKVHSSSDKRNRSRSSSRGAKKDHSISHSSSDKSHKRKHQHNLEVRTHSPDKIKKRVSSPDSRSHGSGKSHKESQMSTGKSFRSIVRNEESGRCRSRSSSSSSSASSASSTSTSSNGSGYKRQYRSVSSVIQSVARPTSNNSGNSGDKRITSETEFVSSKRGKKSDEISPSLSSSIRTSNYGGGENQSNAPDGSKRMPVHMRLGTLPRKRVIQMTKDVEAAFVNTSSDEDSDYCMRGKKQNFRVVTDLCGSKNDDVAKRRIEKSPFKNVDVSKDMTRRLKIHR